MSKLDLFGAVENQVIDTKYTNKVQIPQYVPSGELVSIYSCYKTAKYDQLLNHIKQSNVSEEEKQFLRLAASRHIVFDYSKIADYYANASKEMQELMEESALVILDINDAIANGFVKLSKRLEKIMLNSGQLTDGRTKSDLVFDNLTDEEVEEGLKNAR